MRLIDADALEEKIEIDYCRPCKTGELDYDGIKCRGCCEFNTALDFLRDSPKVDAVLVVHAHWDVFDECENAYECSKCHDVFILLAGKPEENNYQFCPNCGAKMDGGKHEEH
jgi:DNA-directed RNA polymerase subunit RPC12/RpoP